MAIKPYIQPPFDPRIYKRTIFTKGATDGSSLEFELGSVSTEKKGTLTRGLLKQSEPLPGYSDVGRLNFLYNPSSINASYSILQEVADTLLFPNPDDEADLNVPLGQAVGISLLFDRTYELWDGKYLNTHVGRYGVESDVQAMKQLVGMTNPTGEPAAAGGSKGGGSGGDKEFPLNEAKDVMRMVRCDLYIGGRGSLTYRGYIDSWSVDYTHWTQYMVPARCVINIGFQLLPTFTNKKAAAGVTGTAAGWADPTIAKAIADRQKKSPVPVSPRNILDNSPTAGKGGR